MPPNPAFPRTAFKPPRPINSSSHNFGNSQPHISRNQSKGDDPARHKTRQAPALSPSDEDEDEDGTPLIASKPRSSHVPAPSDNKGLDGADEDSNENDGDLNMLDAGDDDDAIDQAASSTKPVNRSQMKQPRGPAVPSVLLSRIVHDTFKHPDTRMTKEALAVLSMYIETFAKEAIFRAEFEKRDREREKGRTAGEFLEVSESNRLSWRSHFWKWKTLLTRAGGRSGKTCTAALTRLLARHLEAKDFQSRLIRYLEHYLDVLSRPGQWKRSLEKHCWPSVSLSANAIIDKGNAT